MKFDLIGIHGKPRAGKDTISNYICRKYNLTRHGPSVYVKRVAAVMFNVPEDCFYDELKKETTDPFWEISYREMAQKVGKESSRDVFGDDFWMRHVGRHLELIRERAPRIDEFDTKGMVLPDIRYANEAKWVKDNGGIVLFVERPNRQTASNESHPAERGLPKKDADAIILNAASTEELHSIVEIALDALAKDPNIQARLEKVNTK